MSNLNMNTTVDNRAFVNTPDTVRSAQFDWMRGLVAQPDGVRDVLRGGTMSRGNGARADTDHGDLLAVFEALSRIPG